MMTLMTQCWNAEIRHVWDMWTHFTGPGTNVSVPVSTVTAQGDRLQTDNKTD